MVSEGQYDAHKCFIVSVKMEIVTANLEEAAGTETAGRRKGALASITK